MDDDSELLRRYATTRDEAAFAELVKRRLPLVYHAALRRVNGDAMLAEEIAQSVFVSLARDAATLRHHVLLSGWLYVATRHAAGNALRQNRRRQLREQEAYIMHETTAPVADTAWAQLRPELDAVMDELSDVERDVVLLRYFEDQPYAAIGARLHISEDAARMRAERALERLRALLERRGVASTAAALAGLLAGQSALAAPSGLAGTVAAGVVASATAGTTGALAFMATNKIILIATGVVALAAGGMATYEFAALRQLGNEVAQLQAEKESWEARMRKAEQAGRSSADEARIAQERLARAERRNSEQPSVPVPSGAPAPAKAAARQTPTANRQAYFANADYIRLQLKIAKLGFGLQYGGMYRKLGWSEDKIGEFEQLLLKQQHDLFSIMGAATLAGAAMDDPAVQSAWSEPAVRETQAKLDALLAQDRATFKEYSEMNRAVARSTVNNLAGNLYNIEAPLTTEQAESLVRLISNSTPKSAPVSGIAAPARTDWNAVYANAAGFLSAAQVSALRAVNERNELFAEANALERQIDSQQAIGPSGG